MKATFNFKIKIDNGNVDVILNIEDSNEMDIVVMGQLLKIFADTKKKVKVAAEKFSEDGDAEKQEETLNNDLPEDTVSPSSEN